MKKIKYIVLLIVVAITVSCAEIKFYSDKSNPIVAEIGEKKLYYKDIEIAFKNKSREIDSATVANNFITQWIKNELKLSEAEKLFMDNQVDIDILVERYRNSLLLHKYETYYGSTVDTTIASSDIINYYNLNKYQFKLVSPIVKARVLILPKGYENEEQLRKKMFSRKEDDYQDLLAIAEKDNLVFFNFDEDWVYFSEVVRYFPFLQMSYDTYIEENKFKKITEGDSDYLINIAEYRLSGADMPLNFVYNDVKKAILNQRRTDIYSKIEDSVYYNVLKNNKVYQLIIDSTIINEININK